MIIVSYKICPFVQRVTTLLECKGVSYTVEYVDLGNKPQWFVEASPHSQVPLLINEDGNVLFESDAIVEYIDEVLGEPIFSRCPVKKAQQRAWSYLASKHYLVQCSAQRSKDKVTFDERLHRLHKAFSKIQSQLGDDPFIDGQTMGMIDIAWTVLLHRTEIIERHSGFDFLSQFPKIKRWRESILQTGVPRASVAGDFEDRFVSFYLSDQTYLGQLINSEKIISHKYKDSTASRKNQESQTSMEARRI